MEESIIQLNINNMVTVIIILAVAAVIGVSVWLFMRKNKPSQEEVTNKPSEPVSEPSNPPVDEVPKEDEKEPEKPKFKVGDWIVFNGLILYVKEVVKGFYRTVSKGGITNSYDWSIDNVARLWIIQDAKDGDVLSFNDGHGNDSVELIKSITDKKIEFWFCLTNGNHYEVFDGIIPYTNLVSREDATPATKEQRDLLFQKMHEAGYEWNPDTKELKEIEQPPVEVPTEKPKEKPDAPKPPVIQDEKPKYDEEYESYIGKYSQFADIKRDSYTYRWFYELFREAKSQLRIDTCHGLPILLKQENFPTLYEWGDKGDAQKAQDTLIGWLFSLQLAELKPYYRADIFKVGYEMGGYDRYTNIYGWKFECDPNIMRILAGAIYPTMKGWCKPVTETLRREVEGTRYNSTLQQLYDNNSRDNVAPNAFFTDFRVFMPTAPAPYAPAYSKRPDRTYPNEERDEFDNLKVDRQIHEMIVEAYNLNQPEHYQEVVQAIADKEVEAKHLFGKNRETKNFKFHPVFGEDTIGIELPDEGTLASFAYLAFRTGSSSRGILQSATVNPVQYGRLRPGCSWNQEAKKNSSTDDRRNILTNFEIEDGDGSPTGYYDANGSWVYMDNIHNPEEYEEYQKNALYANSYPSGHSSGMFCCSMVLMELFPNKADRILKEANQYAVNRTIARYHWTSDTINGRVLGSATNAICHAASDYYDMLNKIKKEL